MQMANRHASNHTPVPLMINLFVNPMKRGHPVADTLTTDRADVWIAKPGYRYLIEIMKLAKHVENTPRIRCTILSHGVVAAKTR